MKGNDQGLPRLRNLSTLVFLLTGKNPVPVVFLDVNLLLLLKNVDCDKFKLLVAIGLFGKSLDGCTVFSKKYRFMLRNKVSRRLGNCKIEMPSNKPTYPPMFPTNELMSSALKIQIGY